MLLESGAWLSVSVYKVDKYEKTQKEGLRIFSKIFISLRIMFLLVFGVADHDSNIKNAFYLMTSEHDIQRKSHLLPAFKGSLCC